MRPWQCIETGTVKRQVKKWQGMEKARKDLARNDLARKEFGKEGI